MSCRIKHFRTNGFHAGKSWKAFSESVFSFESKAGCILTGLEFWMYAIASDDYIKRVDVLDFRPICINGNGGSTELIFVILVLFDKCH